MRIKSITISGLRSFGPEPVSETPEDVVVVERPFGHTKLKRLERAPLAHWLQEYSLGHAWESGAIGGRMDARG